MNKLLRALWAGISTLAFGGACIAMDHFEAYQMAQAGGGTSGGAAGAGAGAGTRPGPANGTGARAPGVPGTGAANVPGTGKMPGAAAPPNAGALSAADASAARSRADAAAGSATTIDRGEIRNPGPVTIEKGSLPDTEPPPAGRANANATQTKDTRPGSSPDAELSAELRKCNSLAGSAKTSCVANASKKRGQM